jgi:hypothetical protein
MHPHISRRVAHEEWLGSKLWHPLRPIAPPQNNVQQALTGQYLPNQSQRCLPWAGFSKPCVEQTRLPGSEQFMSRWLRWAASTTPDATSPDTEKLPKQKQRETKAGCRDVVGLNIGYQLRNIVAPPRCPKSSPITYLHSSRLSKAFFGALPMAPTATSESYQNNFSNMFFWTIYPPYSPPMIWRVPSRPTRYAYDAISRNWHSRP